MTGIDGKGGVERDYVDPPKWGVSHTVALALAVMDLDVVRRSTLRALLPAGRTKNARRVAPRAVVAQVARRVNGLDVRSRQMIEEGTRVPRPERVHRNVVSEKFTYALQRFEERGWITRGSEFVLVRSKRSLLDWATSAEPPEEIAFQVSVAIELVESDLSALSAAAVEQRRRELLALKRLMEEGFADSNWSLRGRVRFVPKSNSL